MSELLCCSSCVLGPTNFAVTGRYTGLTFKVWDGHFSKGAQGLLVPSCQVVRETDAVQTAVRYQGVSPQRLIGTQNASVGITLARQEPALEAVVVIIVGVQCDRRFKLARGEI